MARQLSRSDPILALEFWISGFYTYRSQLFAPFRGIGINVVSFKDPVIDGENMEDTDLFQWTRRPGFSIFCPVPLLAGEVINNFDSGRNLDGEVIATFDSNLRLAQFTDTSITTIFSKTAGAGQGFVTQIGNMAFFADGSTNDFQMWDTSAPLSSINPSPWGIPAPTSAPSLYALGCWLPYTSKVQYNPILDPNGNVEIVTNSSGVTGAEQPPWPSTTGSSVGDGSITWLNVGPIESWAPDTSFTTPVVVLDTNGNLEYCAAASSTVSPWSGSVNYAVGDTVLFGGNYWTAVANSGPGSGGAVPPSSNYTTTTGSVTAPSWVLSQNPITTGTPAADGGPAAGWNPTIGGFTSDGDYTWRNIGPGNLIESFGTSYVYCYRTIYGGLSTASPISLNTGSILGPQVSAITGFTVNSDGTVTFSTASDNFVVGSVFSVADFSTPQGVLLNGQVFTTLSTGLSNTSFSASLPNGVTIATGTYADNGSTVNLIAVVSGTGSTSPLCNAVVNITATEIEAGVVTVTAVNNFTPGLWVTFSKMETATVLSYQQLQVTNVDTENSPAQWFEVFYLTPQGVVPPNQPTTPDIGTATFDAVEIYRTSDGGGIYLFAGAVENPISSGTPMSFDTGLQRPTADASVGSHTYPWTNPDRVQGNSAYAEVAALPSPVSGEGSFNIVQSCQITGISDTATPPSQTVSSTMASSVNAGDSILVVVMTFEQDSWSLSDTSGNNYMANRIAQEAFSGSPGGTGVNLSVYLVNNVSAVAANSLQISLTAARHSGVNDGFFAFQAFELSGLSGSVDAGGTVTAKQSTGTSLAIPSLTTSSANAVLFSFLFNTVSHPGDGTAGSVQSPFLSAASSALLVNHDGTTEQLASAFQPVNATGSYPTTWNTSNSSCLGLTLALDLNLYQPSDALQAYTFTGITVPPGAGVTGITVTFNAYVDASPSTAYLQVQLLRAGSPYGNIKTVPMTTSPAAYTVGGSSDLWGVPWLASDFGNSKWGVQITAAQNSGGTNADFFVNNVQVELVGQTGSTTWVYNDFTTDANLDEFLIAPLSHQNDPPPGAPGSSVNQSIGTISADWNGRVWIVAGNYVYFSAGPDCTNGDPNSSFPPANRFRFAGPPLGLVPTPDGGGLIVCLADRYNAILGGPETISFYPTDALSNFGISSPNAIFRDGSSIGQFLTQGQYIELQGPNKADIGEHIADYLTKNFKPATTYATTHRNGLDVGTFLSNGVDQVLRFGSNIAAWSVPAYPIGGAGALRSIETSVGIHSLMLASPTAGVIRSTPITRPTVGVSSGAGVAWTNPGDITTGTSYATTTLSSATGDSQLLAGSAYSFNIPQDAVIQGIVVSVKGKQSNSYGSLTLTPLNPVAGATSHTVPLTSTDSVPTFGSATDLWNMPTWITRSAVTSPTFGFTLKGTSNAVVTPGNLTLLQGPDTNFTSGVASSQSLAFAANTTLGSLMFVWVYNSHTSDLSGLTVSDTIGNTWTFATGTNSGTTPSTGVYWAVNKGSGVDTVSVSGFSGSGETTAIALAEYSGQALVSPVYASAQVVNGSEANPIAVAIPSTVAPTPVALGLDTTVTNSATSGTSVSVGPITPTNTPEWVLFSGPSDASGFNSGWYPAAVGSAGLGAYTGYAQDVNAAVSATATTANTEGWVAALLAFTYPATVFPQVLNYVGLGGAGFGLTFSTFTSISPLAGDTLIVTVNLDEWTVANFPTPTVSDSQNNTWNQIASISENGNGTTGSKLVVFMATNVVGAATSVKVTMSKTGLVGAAMSLYEVTGATQKVVSFAWFEDNNSGAVTPNGNFKIRTAYTTGSALGGHLVMMDGYFTTTAGASQAISFSDTVNPTTIAPSSVSLTINLNPTPATTVFSIAELETIVYYQTPGNYLRARDVNSWGDNGLFGENNGTAYSDCFITVGSITLSQPGAPLIPLQHVVGYFDGVGTLDNGGPSKPDVWILPNEVNDTAGVGFIQLPEVIQEPPEGQNQPSRTIQALRWPLNMMNSQQASQFIHHLQVKIRFEPECAPNTIKALAFKEQQS